MGLVKRIEQVPPEDPLRNDHCLEFGRFGLVLSTVFLKQEGPGVCWICITSETPNRFWGSYWRDANDCEAEVEAFTRTVTNSCAMLCPIRVRGLNLPSSQG